MLHSLLSQYLADVETAIKEANLILEDQGQKM